MMEAPPLAVVLSAVRALYGAVRTSPARSIAVRLYLTCAVFGFG